MAAEQSIPAALLPPMSCVVIHRLQVGAGLHPIPVGRICALAVAALVVGCGKA